MNISIDTEITFSKIQASICDKNSINRSRWGIIFHIIIVIYKHIRNIFFQWCKTYAFPVWSGTRQGCSFSPILFNVMLEVLPIAIK